jgi:hypothetical protein
MTSLQQIIFKIFMTLNMSEDLSQNVSVYLAGKIEYNENMTEENVIESINYYLQKNWLRQAGERDQIEHSESDEAERELHKAFLASYAATSEQSASSNIYVVHGASYDGVTIRLKYLSSVLERELAADSAKKITVYLATGRRDLWIDHAKEKGIILKFFENNEEATNLLTQLLNNPEIKAPRVEIPKIFAKHNIAWPFETDLMKDLSKKILDEYLKNVTIKTIDAHKKENGARPDTQDTITALFAKLKELPDTKTTLCFISNQPHVLFQHTIVEAFLAREGNEELRKRFTIKTIGSVEENISFGVVKDATARMIYAGKELAKSRMQQASRLEEKASHVGKLITERNEGIKDPSHSK